MALPNNAEYISGHDFSKNPAQATAEALRDLERQGVAILHNTVDADALNSEYAKSWPKKSGARRLLPGASAEFLGIQDEINSLTKVVGTDGAVHSGPNNTERPFLSKIGGAEAWHVDGSITAPGIRMITQIAGPEAGLVIARENEDILTTDRDDGGLAHSPKEKAGLLVARYSLGSVVLIASSPTDRLRVQAIDSQGDDQIYGIESPFHTGRHVDDNDPRQRRLVVSNYTQLSGSFIQNFGVKESELRSPIQLPR